MEERGLTFQYHTIRHHLFNMILRLGEEEEYIHNTPLDELGELAVLVEDPIKDK